MLPSPRRPTSARHCPITTVSLFSNGDRHAGGDDGDTVAGLPGVRGGRRPPAGVRRSVRRGARGRAGAHRPVLLLWPGVRGARAGA